MKLPFLLFIFLTSFSLHAKQDSMCIDFFAEEARRYSDVQKRMRQAMGKYDTYLKGIDHNFLSKEEENKLILNIQNKGPRWEEGMFRVLENNILLITKLVKREFTEKSQVVSFEDMLQAGEEGLTIALYKFDPNKGFKFFSYASYWVRERITLELKRSSKTIRVPHELTPAIKQFKEEKEAIRHRLRSEGVYNPVITDHMVVTSLGWKKGLYEKLQPYINLKVSGLERTRNAFDEAELLELEAPSGVVSVRSIENNEVFEIVRKVIKEFEPKEQQLIDWHYGLNGPALKRQEILKRLGGIAGSSLSVKLKKLNARIKVKLGKSGVDRDDLAEVFDSFE